MQFQCGVFSCSFRYGTDTPKRAADLYSRIIKLEELVEVSSGVFLRLIVAIKLCNLSY